MQIAVTIDFNDDLWKAQTDWTPDKLRDCVTLLHRRGIRDIRWVDHGSFEDGVYDEGSGFDKRGCVSRIRDVMPDPRQIIIDRAHELGMTVAQVLKPWDLAFGSPSLLAPHGQPPLPVLGLPEVGGVGMVAHRWLREHPESIVRLHPSLLEGDEPRKPIRTIRLWHEQAALAEAPAIDIYVSQDNFTYTRYDGPRQVSQSVRRRKPPVYAPAPEVAFGPEGEFACLEITGLEIDAPYVVVERAEPWALTNTIAAMLEVEDAAGEPVVYTLGITPCQPGSQGGKAVDWKQGGVAYDCSRQSQLLRTLLQPHAAGRFPLSLAEQTFLAIGRGRNATRGGHVEFADPAGRAWLNSLVREALEAGVDSVDIRFGSHTESLDWENYGFHPAIVEAFKDKHGVDIATQPFDRAAWRELRGDFVDQWLSEVSQVTRTFGKPFCVHVTDAMDRSATQRCMYEIAWHWERWIREGLVDEVTFKAFGMGSDFYRKALAVSREQGVTTRWTRKPGGPDKQIGWIEAMDIAAADGFDWFDLYELAIFQTLEADGQLVWSYPMLQQKIASLT